MSRRSGWMGALAVLALMAGGVVVATATGNIDPRDLMPDVVVIGSNVTVE